MILYDKCMAVHNLTGMALWKTLEPVLDADVSDPFSDSTCSVTLPITTIQNTLMVHLLMLTQHYLDHESNKHCYKWCMKLLIGFVTCQWGSTDMTDLCSTKGYQHACISVICTFMNIHADIVRGHKASMFHKISSWPVLSAP